MALQLILCLSLLVFIHELGHFLAARMFGIRVDKFYIFFDAWGKKLFSKKIGDTEYGIGWLPLGGYVKIAGMGDESMDKEQMKLEPKPDEFRSKPAWQRLIVMIGGIVMNVILGVIVYSGWIYEYKQVYLPVSEMTQGIYAAPLAEEMGLQTGDHIIAVNGKAPERFDDLTSLRLYFGGQYTVRRGDQVKEIHLPGDLFKRIQEPFIYPMKEDLKVESLLAGKNAKKGGMMVGDRIESVDGSKVRNFPEFQKVLREKKGKPIALTVEREGNLVPLTVEVDTSGLLGFSCGTDKTPYYNTKAYTISSAFKYGSKEAFTAVIVNAIGLSKIFTGDVDARESVQSPIGIARMFAPTWDWSRFWYLTALISMILAFMNFLPIPALDGGHIVFIIIEMIRRKPVSDKVLENAQVVGIVLLLLLMVFAVGNDILKGFGI